MINFPKRVPVIAATALLLVACQTTNPYTQQPETSNATKGAAIGAAVGVAAGLISGHSSRSRRKNALIGLGVGALAGGGVGYYMDQQEMKLRQELEGTGVSVTRVGDEIMLNMPGNVTFETNQSDISSRFYPVLDSVAVVLEEYDKTLVEVSGHTDSTGNDKINNPLSERRAASVASYLTSRGVIPQRIESYGAGSAYPIANNDTAEGRLLNRRVEIMLVPVTKS